MRKTFRGYSYEELQNKKKQWLFNNFRHGFIFKIVRENVMPCLLFGDVKLIIEFI